MASQLSSSSPSFNSYSSETLADIAARVLNEFRSDPRSVSDPIFDSWESLDSTQSHGGSLNDQDPDDDDDGEFEFSLVCTDPNSSPVSADDIFCNGQIKPMYPILDTNFLFSHPHFAPSNEVVVAGASVSPISAPNETVPVPRRRRPPLRKLMFEERETWSCPSSASDADQRDVGGVPPETYCVWSQKSGSAGRTSKKSRSTELSSSSKRWRLRDLLLNRSGSQRGGRKEAMLLVSQSKRSSKVAQEVSKPIAGAGAEHQASDYVRKSTAIEDEQTKKSFLPYRQELVGMFSNVNGIGRHLHPF
ncbi:uncharacterized protein LOC129309023 [Prosopis cineraria]|uniref:uncharacterized protein LOC129309023 n=1 Tax=Prosopis cineraria TaxID=364024 RepID=UPI00240FAB87|nr:uncharacterized protein LOC129309023 [Prosopis cineraria]